MLEKLIFFIRQPYPFGGDFGQKLRQNAGIGVFVALFLIVFQPFGAAMWQIPGKIVYLAGFGLVSFIVPTFVQSIVLAWLGKDKAEAIWTVGRETGLYIAILVLVALGNMLYSNIIGISKISFSALTAWVGIVALVAIFPIMAGILLRYERFVMLNQKEAAVLEDQLQHFHREQLPLQTKRLVFSAENGRDRLELAADDLLFIESADNYSNFTWIQNGQIRRQLLRGSMKRFEDQIGENMPILRCHRSYIVNLNHIEHITGNAQGYRLVLARFGMEVPVARNYGPAVLAIFKQVSS